jgi:anti-sigma-K factor RskA
MIDERQQELASLYAFDLLEGAELAQFEAALGRDAELQALVAELRSAATDLAQTAPPLEPPTALKSRIFQSIETSNGTNTIPFPTQSGAGRVVPWAIAAGFAVATAWFGARYYTTQAETEALRQQTALAEVALKSARAQIETEHLVATRLLTDFSTLKTDTDKQLADAHRTLEERDQQLVAARQATEQRDQQLAAARSRETAARTELVALNDRLKHETDLARLKIATLTSLVQNSSAVASAVYDPDHAQGVIAFDKLPAIPDDQRYELWVVTDKPVSAGVITTRVDGTARVPFKPLGNASGVTKFAVSREKNDGLKSHDKPGEVIMISQ